MNSSWAWIAAGVLGLSVSVWPIVIRLRLPRLPGPAQDRFFDGALAVEGAAGVSLLAILGVLDATTAAALWAVIGTSLVLTPVTSFLRRSAPPWQAGPLAASGSREVNTDVMIWGEAGDPDSVRRRRSAALLLLYTAPSTWLRRRTDVAAFLDEVAIRWTRTIELEVPDVDQLGGALLGLRVLPIPLALHSKGVLTGFTMNDGRGGRLSMLSRQEDQPLVEGMLTIMADGVLESVTPPEMLGHLRGIVESPAPTARTHLDALRAGSALLRDLPEDTAERRRQRGILRVLLRELVKQFVLITLIPNEPGSHVVIEYSFVDSFQRQRSGGEGELELEVGSAPSFHVELEAPEELDVASSVSSVSAVGVDLACQGRYLSLWTYARARGETFKLPFTLRLHRPGLPRTAVWVSASTTVIMVLAVFGRFVWNVRPAPDATVAVLVALPAGLLALLVREVRHRLTAELASGARFAIGATSLALLIGATSLALRFPDTPDALLGRGIGYRAVGWCLATVISLGVTVWTWRKHHAW